MDINQRISFEIGEIKSAREVDFKVLVLPDGPNVSSLVIH